MASRLATKTKPAPAKRTIAVYKSYSFRDKDPIIDKLRTILDDEHIDWGDAAELSGVSYSTLVNWFMGATKRPQFATLNAIGRAIGYDLEYVRRRKK